jgi:hypothetical protein
MGCKQKGWGRTFFLMQIILLPHGVATGSWSVMRCCQMGFHWSGPHPRAAC